MPPAVDALLQRVIDGDLDLGVDFDLDLQTVRRNTLLDGQTTIAPEFDDIEAGEYWHTVTLSN